MSTFTHHPVRVIEAEVRHLREVERIGEAGETPFVAMVEVATFVIPILALMMVLAFGAAWLFG